MGRYTTDDGNIKLVCNLDLNKYLGTWYEIGKFSARGQNGLENVTATYSLKDNGKIKVHNKGYKNGKEKGIKGSAWLRNENCKGGLYVRFFWPFKSEYNIIKLADDYRYAVVSGESKDKLWILSRTPKIESVDYSDIIDFLKFNGFKTGEIIKTKQNKDL